MHTWAVDTLPSQRVPQKILQDPSWVVPGGPAGGVVGKAAGRAVGGPACGAAGVTSGAVGKSDEISESNEQKYPGCVRPGFMQH